MSKPVARTYRLSQESVDIVERLAKDFSKRLGSQMSYTKLIDSLIKHCRDLTFAEMTNKNREPEE